MRFSERVTLNKVYANKSKFNAVSNFGMPEMNNLFVNKT